MATLVKYFKGAAWKLEAVREKGALSPIWRNRAGETHQLSDKDFEYGDLFETDDLDLCAEDARARFVLDAVLDRNLAAGWIDRKGTFYSCRPGRHLHMIELALGHNMGQAECHGWVKIEPYSWMMNSSVRRPTPAQKRTLELIGRFAGQPRYVNREVRYEDAFPRGNRALEKLYAHFQEVAGQAKPKRRRAANPAQTLGHHLNLLKKGP